VLPDVDNIAAVQPNSFSSIEGKTSLQLLILQTLASYGSIRVPFTTKMNILAVVVGKLLFAVEWQCTDMSKYQQVLNT